MKGLLKFSNSQVLKEIVYFVCSDVKVPPGKCHLANYMKEYDLLVIAIS